MVRNQHEAISSQHNYKVQGIQKQNLIGLPQWRRYKFFPGKKSVRNLQLYKWHYTVGLCQGILRRISEQLMLI